jgi:signal transduction histidine kinase
MKHMVEDFLNVSRLEVGVALEMNWAAIADLAAIVHEIIAVEGHLACDHQFRVDLPADLPTLWADRSKLEEVLTNLVSNAIKYSPDGGPVVISARRHDDMVEVAVSDRGEGIGPEEQGRLFQRFRRAGGEGRGRRIGGTGIGLFVCKALVEAHGGRIWVDSQVGEGSTFRFTVPVYQGQDRREAADGDPPGA